MIDAFPGLYRQALLQGQRAKLGLMDAGAADDAADTELAEDWLALLHAQRMDFTLAWRHLAEAATGDEAPLRALCSDPAAATACTAPTTRLCAAASFPPTGPLPLLRFLLLPFVLLLLVLFLLLSSLLSSFSGQLQPAG